MNPQNPPDPSSTVAFCQNYGKPLTTDERRVVGQAVFCEPCLAERLAAAPPNRGDAYSYPGGTPGPGYSAGAPLPPWGSAPNPGLAALLGFIPGVGAMYNGQYAKGIVHLIVFAILVSLADQYGIFGLFIAGWVAYQVIEAYHTARARRDGTALPNPFGLNDLAERLGFGRSWPNATATTPPPASSNIPPVPPVTPPPGAEAPRPSPEWESRSWEQPTQQATGFGSGGAPGRDPFSVPPYSTPPTPPNIPYTAVPPVYPPVYDSYTPPANRFPTGAVWLIGLGVLFLIGNAGIFHGFRVYRLLPLLLIGGGVWLFIHKMTRSGPGLADDGSPNYRFRLYTALRGSVWIILTGFLFFLDTAHILSWGRSWPLWIIAAGVMTFLQRTLPPAPPYMPGPPFSYPAQAPPSAPPAAPKGPGTSISIAPHDEEGRQI